MRKRNYKPAVRRAALAVLLLLTGVIQNTFLSALRPGVWLLAPLAVCIALYEKEFAGTFFGVLAGALWDLASPAPDGVYALVFAVLCCACGLLGRRVFRSTLPAAMVLSLAFSLLLSVVPTVYTLVSGGFHGAFSLLLRSCLPCVPIAAALTPVFYYPVRLLERKLNDRTLISKQSEPE